MADISDVENAIVNLIGTTLYPSGNATVSPVLNVPVRVRRGWPTPNLLDADLAAGILNITVFTKNDSEANRTRYPVNYVAQGNIPTPTFTATVSNNTITISGTNNAAINQYVTVLLGSKVVVSYQIQTTDTPTLIAQGLQALIAAQGYACSASNGVLTLVSSVYLQAILGVSCPEIAEIKRQSVQVQIILWCATPTIRDAAGSILDPVFASTTFLTLADTSAARFRYTGTYVHDDTQKVRLYRRDLVYSVEYATTILDTGWQVTSIDTNIEGAERGITYGPPNHFYHPYPKVPTSFPAPAELPIVPTI